VGDLHHDLPVALSPLPYADVVDAIRAGRSGVVVHGPRAFAFDRLSSLGWYYVVVARLG
jgi:hypothetical protein